MCAVVTFPHDMHIMSILGIVSIELLWTHNVLLCFYQLLLSIWRALHCQTWTFSNHIAILNTLRLMDYGGTELLFLMCSCSKHCGVCWNPCLAESFLVNSIVVRKYQGTCWWQSRVYLVFQDRVCLEIAKLKLGMATS